MRIKPREVYLLVLEAYLGDFNDELSHGPSHQ